jgi:hypothetical protein
MTLTLTMTRCSAYAPFDLASVNEREVRMISKPAWLALAIFTKVAGTLCGSLQVGMSSRRWSPWAKDVRWAQGMRTGESHRALLWYSAGSAEYFGPWT